MAGVNNQPNLKPLIDNQSTAQSGELTAAEQAINASIETAKTELSTKSDSVKAAVNAAKTLITDDAQLKADALAVIVEAAKDAVMTDLGEKISALQLAVDTPISVVRSVQRGIQSGNHNVLFDVQVSDVNTEKAVLTVMSQNSAYNGFGFIDSSTKLRVSPGFWELIEYV